jgi:hypothetical protein
VHSQRNERETEADRYKKSVLDIVSQHDESVTDADQFVSQGRKRKRGAPRRRGQEKARLATFSLTKEDLRFVEQATYQVIQALGRRVNKSQTVRLAMRTFAGLGIEELKQLLSRPPAQTLSEQLTRKGEY